MMLPLWQPTPEQIAAANLTAFQRRLSAAVGRTFAEYGELWRFSVDQPEVFWRHWLDAAELVVEGEAEPALVNGERMPGARFFPNLRLNFAENVLAPGRERPDDDALVFWSEDGRRQHLSWRALEAQVVRLSAWLAMKGVGPGDRVAGFLPNLPETVIAMLATARLGGVWSSCSADFGAAGALERFSQIAPKVLFAADGYRYAGKPQDCLPRLREIAAGLPTLAAVVVVPFLQDAPDLAALGPAATRTVLFEETLAAAPAEAPPYARLVFNAPLYLLYSSGTTGLPKAIVHGAGGTLLQHVKEHRLHCDIRPGDRVFYFTTCGWMMWNWLVSALASGATIVLFEGSPFHPRPALLFDLAEKERLTLFGTSAKYLDAVVKEGLRPAATHDLSALRMICSTGSPLAPERFDDVYARIKKDVCLASISGGTDIISCFMLGCPTRPVWRGEIQARGLGMAVEVFDDDGRPLRGKKGELVCTKPFPSMPLGFWNDPDGRRYRASYFERFPNVWHHGDYVELTAHDGIVVYGRSDAVLNPGGVRIGTAEIYRQVEGIEEVLEAVAVGQEWEGDIRIVLFVRLREGFALDDTLVARIKEAVRTGASPRHVPARIVQVPDIPRTRNGKIVELAIREAIHGRPVKNVAALANPEALDHFRDRPELAS